MIFKNKKIEYIFNGLPFFWIFLSLTILIERILNLSEQYEKEDST